MHISTSTWLVLSTALLPTATAFYPYHYGDSNPASRSRRTTPQSPDSKASLRSINLPIRRVSSPSNLRSRQNAYNIVNSNDPKQTSSVAIDQDGGDLSYMVAVTIGDSKEEYHLLLDSAASNTWVMGQDCATDACKTHNTFGKGDSSSLKTQDTPFSVTYGTGSVSGTLASDTLHIGSLSSALTFGLATNVSEEFESYPMDGILGIGRGVKTEGSIDAPQLMDVLSSNKLISAKLYGIHLSRSTDGVQDGELNLGQVNKNRFTGDLNYLDAIANPNGFWEIPIDNAGVDGVPVGLTGRTAILDTGTSFILMPEPDAIKLHSQIRGSTHDAETFSVPCDTTATISFSFNNHVYNISTADWRAGKLASGLCRSNIIGRQTFSDAQWLVGDVFLKNVYSVFDFEQKRVGLGVKREDTSGAAAPSGTAGGPAQTPVGTAGARPLLPGGSPGVDANPSTASTQVGQGQGQGGVQKGEASALVPRVLVVVVALAAASLWVVV